MIVLIPNKFFYTLYMENQNLRHSPLVHRIALGTLFFNQGIIFATWASRIADVKTKLNLNEADLGGILFALPLGQICAMWLSGLLVTRFGSRAIILVASFLHPSVLVALSFAYTPTILFAMLMFFGMSSNLNNISINTQAVGVERIYGRSIMSSFHGLWSLAGFCGGLLSAFLVAENVGMFSNFIGVFIYTTISMLVAWHFLLREDIKPEVNPDDAKKKRTMFTPTPFILILGIIAFGCMSCEGTMYDWSVVYFKEVIGASQDTCRIGYIAFMSAMATGRFVDDWMITKFGIIRVLQSSGILVFVGMMIAVVFPDILWSSLGFLLVGAGVSSVVPTCYSLAGKSRRMSSSMAIATVSTIGFFGFLMGPPLIGFIAHASSLRWSLAMMASIGLLVTLLAPTMKKRL